MKEPVHSETARKDRPEDAIFRDLEGICATAGYIHVLAYFCFRDNFLLYSPEAMTPEDMAKSYAPERLIRTEIVTLIGLMVKSPISFDLPDSQTFQRLIDQTQSLLKELHQCLNRPMMNCFSPAFRETGQDPFTRADVLREPIFYGGESAYSFQYRDLARLRYASDREWMHREKGFDIDAVASFALAISKIHDERMLETLKNMKKISPDEWTFLPGLTCAKQEIAARSGLPMDTINSICLVFCAQNFPCNDAFCHLSDFNEAVSKPLIMAPNGDLICLNMYNLYEAIYDSPFYWMIGGEYGNNAVANRGKFTESFVHDRLQSVFGEGKVFRNVDLYISNAKRLTEIDVLVVFADRLVVVQCKSKKLTLEARRGNDLQLQDDFKKAVQAGYDQALLASKAILDGEVELRVGDRRVELPAVREIYPVSVVSDHYPALTVQGTHFLNFERNEIINPPLVTDVFFIDVLTEMLDSPLRLLSYINRRANFREKVHSINELTVLGYHLSKNLWFDDGLDFAYLADDFGIDLDVAMTVRREGVPGNPTPDGILSRLQTTTLGKIIRGIEHAPEPALVDLGFLLLTLGEDTIRALSEAIDKISAQTKRDGCRHDVTSWFDGAKTGLTVHSNMSLRSEAVDGLANHCRLRKYKQRADSWFGLSVRPSDSMPLIGLQLKGAWSQDDRLDQLTKDMGAAPMYTLKGRHLRKAKVGRNEKCPCGSGLKYKRCCLRQ